MQREKISHPAKYTDSFIPIFSDYLPKKGIVLDPFAGTGKIGKIKQYGFEGKIWANEIEPEWIDPNPYKCDIITHEDAEEISYNGFVDAICTSPTYGNRMADHHNAKDGSKRNTYTHCLGRTLNSENTGKMQWGKQYQEKHIKIYQNLFRLLKPGGMFLLNVKNHIRKGEEINVKQFHEKVLTDLGLKKQKELFVETRGCRCGKNGNARAKGEYILVFVKED